MSKKKRGYAVLSFALLALVGIVAFAQSNQIQGVITARSGATMTVRSQNSENVVVVLTPSTQVDESEGLFKFRKKQMGVTALIPGLQVEVKGSYNGKNQLVADTVRFKGSSLQTAEDIQAGVAPTHQLAEANQKAIVATNKRFSELDDYNVLGQTTVYFGNDSTVIDPQYKPQLLQLAQKAMGITGYMIQIKGYASAVGSAALNQKLSTERAYNVLDFIEQQGNVPLTNILAPGAMGTTNQIGSNATAEGQAENRRVVVSILQNKGIAGS